MFNITRSGQFVIESPSNRVLQDGVTQEDLNTSQLTVENVQKAIKSKTEDVEVLFQELLEFLIKPTYEPKTKDSSNEGGDSERHQEHPEGAPDAGEVKKTSRSVGKSKRKGSGNSDADSAGAADAGND